MWGDSRDFEMSHGTCKHRNGTTNWNRAEKRGLPALLGIDYRSLWENLEQFQVVEVAAAKDADCVLLWRGLRVWVRRFEQGEDR
jgi:hypothetical protein